jgi:hypothetical protein
MKAKKSFFPPVTGQKEMNQLHYDNRDNLERLKYLVWDAGGKVQWQD